MSESDSTLEPGAVLDERYELTDEIARGGFGRVYRARQMNIDRDVAIKMLPPKFMDLPDLVRRFEREARLASRLSHPNTITVHDYGQHGDYLFLVMELLEGEDLADVLARKERLSLDRIARIARQVLKSLNEAHQHSIVHRDLKPENIFLTEISGEQDFVKVVDFGIAKLAMPEMTREGDRESHRSLTVEGNTVGTPTYMSPEQAAGSEIDARSDLYALGVILYEMAAGRPPFDHDDAAKLMRKHIFEPVPAFDDERLQESWLEAVVERALEKEKKDRFQDATEFLEAIDYAIEASEDGRAFAPTREQSEVDLGDSPLEQDSDAFFPSDDERTDTRQGGEEPSHDTPSGGTHLGAEADGEALSTPSEMGNTSSSIVTVLEPSPEEDVIVLDEPKEPPPGAEPSPREASGSDLSTAPAPVAPVEADDARAPSAGEPGAENGDEADGGPADEAPADGGAEPSASSDQSWSWDDSTHVPDEDFEAEMYTTTIERGTNWGWIVLWLLVAAGAVVVGYLYASGQLL